MYFIISKVKPVTLLAKVASRVDARAQAKTLNGTVKTEAEVAKIEFAKPTIMELAQKVATSPKVRTTVGKKDKAPRHAPTAPAAMLAGERALAAAIKAELNKVGIVRAVAKVAGLQRRDVFTIIGSNPKLAIAGATISTQYQVVRSGKLNK